MLKVKILAEGAKAPTVAHPGEDLGYDLYALEEVILVPGMVSKVRTGVAVEAFEKRPRTHYETRFDPPYTVTPQGLLIRDRSSMASRGIFSHGGVIDAGYRGEIVVLLTSLGHCIINAGDKISQMIPVPVLTGDVVVVDDLAEASRGDRGFGSSGR
jgi:dUTP pyrophosphatase